MIGTTISDLARALIADPDSIRWDGTEMIAAINAAMRDVVTHEPKAGTAPLDILLTINVARQAVPNTIVKLLDVNLNLGTSGSTIGNPISRTRGEVLMASRRTWAKDKGGSIRQWWDDDRDPGYFYVWPCPNAAMYVRGLGIAYPADITALGNTLGTFGVNFANPLTHNVLSRLFMRDADDVKNLELANHHMQIYAQLMGIKIERQKKYGAGANSAVNPAFPAVEKTGI